MPYTEYKFSISATLNNAIAPDALENIIITSEQMGYGVFTVVYDHISIDGGAKTFSVWFKNPLSEVEVVILNRIVADHDGKSRFESQPVVIQNPKEADGTLLVAPVPRKGDEWVIGTHNFCDPCSWFGDSVRVHNETLITTDGRTFHSAHENWIDMASGRMHNEPLWIQMQQSLNPSDPHGYQVEVKVDGVTAVMREPFETTGGDYEVLWDSGEVLFFADQTGHTVTASYSYATTNAFHISAPPGKQLILEDAECDISLDAVMTDEIVYGGFAYNPETQQFVAVDPQLGYKRTGQLITEARGCYPPFGPIGSTSEHMAIVDIREFRRKSRGMKFPRQGAPFNYATVRVIPYGAELRVYTRHGRAMTGESVTLTFYCTQSDLPA